jgi:hypothetical protein
VGLKPAIPASCQHEIVYALNCRAIRNNSTRKMNKIIIRIPEVGKNVADSRHSALRSEDGQSQANCRINHP